MPTFSNLDLLDGKVNLAYTDYAMTPFLLIFALTKGVVRMKPLLADAEELIEKNESKVNLIRLKLIDSEMI